MLAEVERIKEAERRRREGEAQVRERLFASQNLLNQERLERSRGMHSAPGAGCTRSGRCALQLSRPA